MKKIGIIGFVVLCLAACGSQVTEFDVEDLDNNLTDSGSLSKKTDANKNDANDSGYSNPLANGDDDDSDSDSGLNLDAGNNDSGNGNDAGATDGGNCSSCICSPPCFCKSKCNNELTVCKNKCENECNLWLQKQCLYKCECLFDSCMNHCN